MTQNNIDERKDGKSTLRQMYTLLCDNMKQGEEPERLHPDFDKVQETIDSFYKLGNNGTSCDIYDIINCYAESYYIEGLKQGAALTHQLFDSKNNPFNC